MLKVVHANHKNRQDVRSLIGALSTGAWTTIPISIEDAVRRDRDAASKNENSKDFLTLVFHSYDLFVEFQGSRPLKLHIDIAANRLVCLPPTDAETPLEHLHGECQRHCHAHVEADQDLLDALCHQRDDAILCAESWVAC